MLLVVAGALAIPLAASCAGGLRILSPRIQCPSERTRCQDQLRQLGGAFVGHGAQRGASDLPGGAAAFLELVAEFAIPPERLLCPGDSSPVAAGHSVSAVDRHDAAALRAVCSYAVRDFTRYPLDPNSTRPQIIAADADVHHRDGLNVLWDDGSVQFLDRMYLNLAPDEPIVVGPDSPHPELRKLCIVPER